MEMDLVNNTQIKVLVLGLELDRFKKHSVVNIDGIKIPHQTALFKKILSEEIRSVSLKYVNIHHEDFKDYEDLQVYRCIHAVILREDMHGQSTLLKEKFSQIPILFFDESKSIESYLIEQVLPAIMKRFDTLLLTHKDDIIMSSGTNYRKDAYRRIKRIGDIILMLGCFDSAVMHFAASMDGAKDQKDSIIFTMADEAFHISLAHQQYMVTNDRSLWITLSERLVEISRSYEQYNLFLAYDSVLNAGTLLRKLGKRQDFLNCVCKGSSLLSKMSLSDRIISISYTCELFKNHPGLYTRFQQELSDSLRKINLNAESAILHIDIVAKNCGHDFMLSSTLFEIMNVLFLTSRNMDYSLQILVGLMLSSYGSLDAVRHVEFAYRRIPTIYVDNVTIMLNLVSRIAILGDIKKSKPSSDISIEDCSESQTCFVSKKPAICEIVFYNPFLFSLPLRSIRAEGLGISSSQTNSCILPSKSYCSLEIEVLPAGPCDLTQIYVSYVIFGVTFHDKRITEEVEIVDEQPRVIFDHQCLNNIMCYEGEEKKVDFPIELHHSSVMDYLSISCNRPDILRVTPVSILELQKQKKYTISSNICIFPILDNLEEEMFISVDTANFGKHNKACAQTSRFGFKLYIIKPIEIELQSIDSIVMGDHDELKLVFQVSNLIQDSIEIYNSDDVQLLELKRGNAAFIELIAKKCSSLDEFLGQRCFDLLWKMGSLHGRLIVRDKILNDKDMHEIVLQSFIDIHIDWTNIECDIDLTLKFITAHRMPIHFMLNCKSIHILGIPSKTMLSSENGIFKVKGVALAKSPSIMVTVWHDVHKIERIINFAL